MYDVVIVGGGIVGLATALKIKQTDFRYRVAVVEKEATLAAHQTGHNSGVIHSGIYYKPGSLKAKNCIEGYHELLRFCTEEGVNYELCGKVIVATSEKELPMLDQIYQRGLANGLSGLAYLSSEQIKEREPHIQGIKGILVPQTGIIDYTEVALKYAERFKHFGGEIYNHSEAKSIHDKGKFLHVHTTLRDFQTRMVVNCAGLYSDKVAHLTRQKVNVKIVPFRGEYYMLKKEKAALINHLVYPVPDPNFPFLGVHFTRMIHGGVEAGPNAVLAFRREGYKKRQIHVGELMETLFWPGFQKVAYTYWKTGMGELYRSFSKAAFTKALQRLMPEIKADDLIKAEAGVRAQACDRQGNLLDDFSILEGDRYIHVLNAPSPAATSSLSIGQTVAKMVTERV